MTNEDFDAQLELFYGGANVNSATVYARLSGQRTGQGLTLSGFVRGPHCLHSTMLPATIRLTDAGPGESLLAKAVVPDPCYWTAELPSLYDVHLELKRDDQTIATSDRIMGLRQFGRRGNFFYQNSKRWTVRAAFAPQPPADLLAWHDTPLSLCMANPNDALCDEASRVGVMILARLGVGLDLQYEIRRLARHAAVAIIVLEVGVPENLQHLAPNTVLASRTAEPWDLNGAAALVKAAEELLTSGKQVQQWNLPIIAQKLMDRPADPAAARQACDQLQAALAPLGDFAGYLV